MFLLVLSKAFVCFFDSFLDFFGTCRPQCRLATSLPLLNSSLIHLPWANREGKTNRPGKNYWKGLFIIPLMNFLFTSACQLRKFLRLETVLRISNWSDKQIDDSFLCVSPLIGANLRHNIVKVAVEPRAAGQYHRLKSWQFDSWKLNLKACIY